jgi:uncharacterized membrane protein YfcA
MADAVADYVPIALALLFVFLAAIVRGYSGFGFSLLAITALSLVMPPRDFIPAIFMLEIAASIHMLPGLWREIHWRSLAPLVIGTAMGTPVGVWFLTSIPPAPMQLALAAFVLIVTALLWSGFSLKAVPGTAASTAVGATAGVLNGAFGIGGPPVIIFYFASPAGHAVGRASIVGYFLVSDVLGLAFQSREGLVTLSAATLALLFLPALALGVWLGARSFRTADSQVFRRVVLVLLAVLAVLTGGQAGLNLLHNALP